MKIKPNVGIIVRSKQKFFWIALALIIINIYFIIMFTKVSEGENLSGQIIMVLTLFNFPLFILSIFLGFAPLMYKKRYEQTEYVFNSDCIEIRNKEGIKRISVSEMNRIDMLEHRALVWCDNGKRRYDLVGLTPEAIETIQIFNEENYMKFY